MYVNPVKVIETNDWHKECLRQLVDFGVKNPLVVTSRGNLKRQNISKYFTPDSFFSEIESIPTLVSCQRAIDFCQNKGHDGVVAIGGGSTMDTAKVILSALRTRVDKVQKLLESKASFKHDIASIFIPTTHGTGSEVTMWSTIWNMVEQKKCSLEYLELYPKVAILDASLTLSLPLNTSLISILDALSHSFEAIWNKNINPESTNYAIEAICLILNNVENLKDNLHDIVLRRNLLKAANIAGLAFSNTRTAAAHSISYPLTAKFNIPHGIAASLSLLSLLEINKKAIRGELDTILAKLGLKGLNELEDAIGKILIAVGKPSLKDWGVRFEQIPDIVRQSYTKGRMDNNIIDLSEDDVCKILEQIF